MFAWIVRNTSIYMFVAGAIFLEIATDASPTEFPYKVCPGRQKEVGTRLNKKKGKYYCLGCDELRNCTSVFGSVHLKGITFNDRNKHLREELRFPELREITGHLIVTFVNGDTSLSDIFPNLAVIHGRVDSLFEGYSLVVYQNKGLRNLGLNSLTVIKQGGIKIEFNEKLCYLDQIRWQSLRNYGGAKKYELSLKRNSKDCFAQCSSICHTPSGHGSSGHKYCWGRDTKQCQKFCISKCGSSGCEDGSQEKCCDKECLGGCTRAFSADHCHACQHLRLGNGSCTRSCPRGFKELENFICKRRCPFAIPFVLNGKCYKECPAGYTSSPKRPTCEKCPEDNCPRTCRPEGFKRGINILSLSDSAKLKGCTIYSGNVAIEMQNVRGGTNIAQVLTDHLGSLEEIRGHVVVRQSTPLISLNFFKNLRKITLRDNFSGFSSKGYALAIFDNPNLESLWEFHPNFKINNRNPKTINGMFVQLNPRLCLKNIYPLVEDVLKWNKSDPNVDISETTNGNARNCDVNFVNLTITGRQKCLKPGLCVKVSWPNKVEDYRNLILYSVWYRETTSTDLNEYDDIDACNSDHVWERQDVSSKRRPIISGTVYGLKAHTLYAFRVKAIVIGGTGVKSYITYFKTRQTKPSVPRSHEVSYLSSSSLQVKWREPFFPNGEITHYLVKYKESSSSSYLWNLNINVDWCQNIDSSINFYKKKKVKDKLTSGNQTCPVNLTCNCDNEKDEKQSLDLKEALFAKEFQDKILQEVFKKNDTNNNKITTTPRPCGNYSKNSSCSTQRPNTQELSTSISTTPTSVLSTTTAPLVILNTTQQTIILEGLKYFTEYSVEVCACNSGAGCGENRGYVTQCSTVLGRTGKSDTADDVGDTLTFDAYNDSKQFTLTWKAPDRPNGKVLRYDVWIQYKPIKGNETVDDQQCVIDAEYIKKGASFGDYTAKVRAITPVGNGSWSNQVNFRIDEKITPPGIEAQKEDANFVTVVGVSVGAILFALVVFVVLTFSLVKRHKKSKHGAGVLFSSTNPEYWNCSDVYVPDEWEVPRGDVTLIRELGNGSFGMVWEGEAVGILPGVHSCKVAVKTVSDTSSIRDKVEFLKEASIMKAFNCNHVLRLLGVVSAGDPVLVIMELMENGDLKSFLRKRRPDSEEDCSLPPPTNVELFQMAAEIADGMAYLADRKFVHRDLAARNCMVSGNQTCKIGDFGLARDVYETDYYRKGTKGFLPVRWMSPESLRDGVFCSASDVWSYGVVLWEMATLAEQPYQGKSNEEVMKFVLDGNIMDIPESYPRKLLEIMLLCWQQKPRNRPTFLSIVENLEGYLTLDFTERSFYHNGRPRKETDSSSLVSLGTENDNLSELPDFLTDHAPKSPIPRESFV